MEPITFCWVFNLTTRPQEVKDSSSVVVNAGITTLKLPYLKKRGGGVGAGGGAGGGKDRLWLSVHWPDDRPSQLLSSCFR